MTTIDCRSEAGKTIGLIDAILTAAHLLVERDLSHPEVREALLDMVSDGELIAVYGEGLRLRKSASAAQTAAKAVSVTEAAEEEDDGREVIY